MGSTLHTLEGIASAIENPGGRRGQLYCPPCGALRSADVWPTVGGAHWSFGLSIDEAAAKGVILRCTCRNCGFTYFGTIFKLRSGPQLIFLATANGGVVTTNTPPEVAFFLDQAQRAEGVGAMTAALPMYRAALDRVLQSAGYNQRMCGEKLGALQKDIDARTAPAWAQHVPMELMRALKKLGDGAAHDAPNLTQWSEEDAELVSVVKAAFAFLLDEVYEVAARRAALTARLKAATTK